MFRKIFFLLIKIGIIVFIVASLVICILYKYYSAKLPSVDEILNVNGRNVEVLYSNSVDEIRRYSDVNVDSLNYSEIPQDLINALIATEDRKFFSHGGLDYIGILRAMIVNLKSGSIRQGGSTITQQLAKMILNDNSRTLRRKFKELVLTKKIEKNLTKENILSLYLSKAYFGAGNYGIKSASKFYFAKNLSDLKLEECAMLVGLLKAPSKYNPLSNEDLTQGRTTQVIINMRDAGFIAENDIFSYLTQDLDFISYRENNSNQSYFFSDWIFNQLDEYTDNTGNISVVTTLDYNIQNIVTDTVAAFVENNEKKLGKSELAVLVMNKNGEILSMIGGKNYKRSQFNRAIHAHRQIGSLFKIFIYLTGFENGLKINDIFIDEPIKIENWYPENNDSKYRGKITVAEAFAYSSNSVAVQVADYFGIENVLKTANKLGLVDEFKKDLTVTLGSQESTLLDITAAYATVANGGIPVFPHAIKHVISSGNIVYKRNISEKMPIFDEISIENMQYLLFNTIINGSGKNAKVQSLVDKTNAYNYSHTDAKFFIGGKTGTNQDYRDAWFVGFADDYVIGIWMGNDDNTPTNKLSGGNLPASLWREIVENII